MKFTYSTLVNETLKFDNIKQMITFRSDYIFRKRISLNILQPINI